MSLTVEKLFIFNLDVLSTVLYRWVYFHALEKEMAIHSSVLAWGILWTGEPGRLQSIGVTKNGTGLNS